MPAVPNPLLQHYVKLTEFLGYALGPDYEVALHDLTDKNRSIIAIANNHVSGREVGAPLTNVALSILRDKSYERADFRLNYYGVSVNGKELEPLFLLTVGPGKKAVDTMVFYQTELMENHIKKIETITASFKAFNEKLETVFEAGPLQIPVSE